MKNKFIFTFALVLGLSSPIISQAEELRDIKDIRGPKNHFADIAINYDGPLFDYSLLKLQDYAKKDTKENASQDTSPEEITIDIDSPKIEKTYSKDEIYALNEDNIIKVLDDTRFVFSSGAGAWFSELIFGKDGNFTGWYKDSDYDRSVECTIEGRFVVDSKVNDTCYILSLVDPVITSPSNRSYVRKVDDIEVTNYYVDHFYGFEKDDLQNFSFQDKFTLYTPYRRFDEMSPEVNDWLRITHDKKDGDVETDKFVLVNNSTIQTFKQRPMPEKY